MTWVSNYHHYCVAAVKTEYSEDSARLSPDGRWLAYRSTRSGRAEIWVRALAGSAPVRVSENGGREPMWSRDGQELYYLEASKMIARAVASGQNITFSSTTVLCDRPYFHGQVAGRTFRGQGAGATVDTLRTYDVAADGRFVMIPEAGGATNPATSPATGIVVVQNWLEELKRLVPIK
jgi:hypothetical protein